VLDVEQIRGAAIGSALLQRGMAAQASGSDYRPRRIGVPSGVPVQTTT